jgi:hypothetical protein
VVHVKQWGLDEDTTTLIQGQYYFNLAQIPDPFLSLLSSQTGIVVRTKGSPLAQIGSIRHALLILIALAAYYIAARRAANVKPMLAVRYE